ncbi:hypothetical protein AHAS_Ahas17G0159700 [Arachis hypogaea]
MICALLRWRSAPATAPATIFSAFSSDEIVCYLSSHTSSPSFISSPSKATPLSLPSMIWFLIWLISSPWQAMPLLLPSASFYSLVLLSLSLLIGNCKNRSLYVKPLK